MPEQNMNNYNETNDIGNLIGKLRTMDDKNLRELRRWQIIIGIMAIFYIFLWAIHPDTIILIDTTGLLVFFVVYTVYYFKLSRKDYSVPVKKLLLNTSKTYSFFNPVFLITALVAAPMVFGAVKVLFDRYFTAPDWNMAPLCFEIGVFGIFFSIVILIAYLVWHARYHEVMKEINQSLKELEE